MDRLADESHGRDVGVLRDEDFLLRLVVVHRAALLHVAPVVGTEHAVDDVLDVLGQLTRLDFLEDDRDAGRGGGGDHDGEGRQRLARWVELAALVDEVVQAVEHFDDGRLACAGLPIHLKQRELVHLAADQLRHERCREPADELGHVRGRVHVQHAPDELGVGFFKRRRVQEVGVGVAFRAVPARKTVRDFARTDDLVRCRPYDVELRFIGATRWDDQVDPFSFQCVHNIPISLRISSQYVNKFSGLYIGHRHRRPYVPGPSMKSAT